MALKNTSSLRLKKFEELLQKSAMKKNGRHKF